MKTITASNLGFLLFLSLLLGGCSASDPIGKGFIDTQALSAPSEDDASSSYSFGEELTIGASVASKRFVFTKDSQASENAASSVVLDSGDGAFYVASATGCNRELKKAADKCYVTVKFMKSSQPGSYSGSLSVGEEGNYNTIELSASVAEPDTSSALVLYEGSSPVDSLSFGNLEAKATLTKTLTLKNEGVVALPVTVSLSGDSEYIKNTDYCNGKTLGINETCYIKVTFKAPSIASVDDEYKYADLQINDSSFSAEGMIVGTSAMAALANVKLYEGSEEKTTIDYGTVAQNKTVTKTIALKNEGTGASDNLNIYYSGSAGVAITLNNCPVVLLPKKSCYIKLTLQTPSNQEEPDSIVGDLSIAGNLVQVSAEVEGIPTPVPASIVFEVGGLPVTSVALGQVDTNAQTVVVIKNTGSSNTASLSAQLSSSDYSLSSSLCNNKVLKPNQSCQVRVVFAKGSKADGSYNASLSFGDSSLSFSASVGTEEEEGNPAYTVVGASALYNTTLSTGEAESIKFADNGNRVYIQGQNSANVFSYTLSTPYDLTTATFVAQANIGVADSYTQIYVTNDGTKLFVSKYNDSNIRQFTFGTPFDITTLSAPYTFSTGLVSGGVDYSQMSGMTFNSQGNKLYLMAAKFGTGTVIFQFSLSSNFDISTASYDGVVGPMKNWNGSVNYTNAKDLVINSSGTKMLVVAGSPAFVYEHSLSSPFDISSMATQGVELSISAINDPRGIDLKNDDSQIYICRSNRQVFVFDLVPEE